MGERGREEKEVDESGRGELDYPTLWKCILVAMAEAMPALRAPIWE
jgi:hypothetical protein